MESPSALTATSMNTWQKSVDQIKRSMKQEYVSKCDKEGHIARDCRGKQTMKKGRLRKDQTMKARKRAGFW